MASAFGIYCDQGEIQKNIYINIARFTLFNLSFPAIADTFTSVWNYNTYTIRGSLSLDQGPGFESHPGLLLETRCVLWHWFIEMWWVSLSILRYIYDIYLCIKFIAILMMFEVYIVKRSFRSILMYRNLRSKHSFVITSNVIFMGKLKKLFFRMALTTRWWKGFNNYNQVELFLRF